MKFIKRHSKKGIYDINDAYKKPSYLKYHAWLSIVKYCDEMFDAYEYYITFVNCQTFGMICKYIGNDGKKHLRYWTPYNTYDCEVIE